LISDFTPELKKQISQNSTQINQGEAKKGSRLLIQKAISLNSRPTSNINHEKSLISTFTIKWNFIPLTPSN
jgi:hypothetical protein